MTQVFSEPARPRPYVSTQANLAAHKKKAMLFAFVLVAMVVSTSMAQNLDFVRTWGGCDLIPPLVGTIDEARGIAVAPNGRIYTVGRTQVDGVNGSVDALILSFDPVNPANNWHRRWGGPGEDIAESVAIGPDGAVYVVGRTTSFGAGSADAFVLRLNPEGTMGWQMTWGTSASDDATGVALSPDGTILYIAGPLVDVAVVPSFRYTFILRLNPATGLPLAANGEMLWTGGPAIGLLSGDSLAVAPDGTVYVAGRTDPGPSDAFVLSLNPATPTPLAVNWAARWQAPEFLAGTAEPAGLAADANGVVMVGQGSPSFMNFQTFLARLTPTGTLSLQEAFWTTVTGWAMDVALGPGGSMFVATDPAGEDVRVMGLTQAGAVQSWTGVIPTQVLAGSAYAQTPSVRVWDCDILVSGRLLLVSGSTLPLPGLSSQALTPLPVPTNLNGTVSPIGVNTEPVASSFVTNVGTPLATFVMATGSEGPPVSSCGNQNNDEAFVGRFPIPWPDGNANGVVDICEPITVYDNPNSFNAATCPLPPIDFELLPAGGSSCPSPLQTPIPNPLVLNGVTFTDPVCLSTGFCSSPTCAPDPDNPSGGNTVLFLNPGGTIGLPAGTQGVMLVIEGIGSNPFTLNVTDFAGNAVIANGVGIPFGAAFLGFTSLSGISQIQVVTVGGTGGSLAVSAVLPATLMCNTPVGANVAVNIIASNGIPITVTFGSSSVTTAGNTTATVVPCEVPGYLVCAGQCFDINTTATYTGPVTVCFGYLALGCDATVILQNGVPIPTVVNITADVICGTTNTLSVFAPAICEDSDGDGVCEVDDSCPGTDPGGSCLPGFITANGCSAEQAVDTNCPPTGTYKNHGAYVRCTAHVVEDVLSQAGLEEGTETYEEVSSCLINPRARSGIGKKP